jgi:hypothetical protein
MRNQLEKTKLSDSTSTEGPGGSARTGIAGNAAGLLRSEPGITTVSMFVSRRHPRLTIVLLCANLPTSHLSKELSSPKTVHESRGAGWVAAAVRIPPHFRRELRTTREAYGGYTPWSDGFSL